MEVQLAETAVGGFSAVQMQNGRISATIVPALGGKIASIRNLLTGREWLWTSPYLSYRAPRYGVSYVEEFDTGGFDECFPTVDACCHPLHPWEGVHVPDHGEVFAQEWQVNERKIGADGEAFLSLSCAGVRFPYRFSRTVVMPPDKAQLELRYEVENLCAFALPFIWCAHPIMRIEPGMRIELPKQTRAKIGFAVGDYPGCAGDAFVWPEFKRPAGDPLDLSRVPNLEAPGGGPFAVKLFTEALREGWAALRSPDGRETFRFTFALEEIRHVAMWLNYGAWSGSGSPPYFNMAFEPAIGPCDALDVAVRYHHCAEDIPPWATRAWRLGVRIG